MTRDALIERVRQLLNDCIDENKATGSQFVVAVAICTPNGEGGLSIRSMSNADTNEGAGFILRAAAQGLDPVALDPEDDTDELDELLSDSPAKPETKVN